MKQAIFYMLFVFLGINTVYAQKPYELQLLIDSVPVNKSTNRKKLNIQNRFNSPKERHRALRDALYFYYEKGFLLAEADSVGGDSLLLIADISLGTRFTKTRIHPGNLDRDILGNSVWKDKLMYGETFSPKRYTDLLRSILTRYENNGYPFAAVFTDSLNLNPGETSMRLRVEKGPIVKIDSLVLRGNANIKKSFLYGYLGIKPGDLYNEKQIRSLNSRLKELPFLTVERPQRIEFTDTGKANIILFAKKVNASRFNGLIGFMPGSANNGRLLITGEADLGLWNALGYGEQLTLKWRRIQAGTQSLNAFVKYPYLFGTPLAVNGHFDFFRRDSTFQNIGFGFGVQYLFIGTNYTELFYRRQIAQVIDAKKFANAQTLPESIDFTANNIGVKFNFEQYDYRWNPTRGYLIRGSVWGGNKVMQRRSDIPEAAYAGLQLRSYQFGAELQTDVFIRLHKRFTLKPGVMLAHSINPYRFLNELYRIGGINSLRGFDEESIYVSSYALGNLELRYLIEQNSNVYVFLNGGWLERSIVGGYYRDTPYGFGAGMNFFTRAGFINLAYALGSSQGNPIQFRSGKIHLGFTGVF